MNGAYEDTHRKKETETKTQNAACPITSVSDVCMDCFIMCFLSHLLAFNFFWLWDSGIDGD